MPLGFLILDCAQLASIGLGFILLTSIASRTMEEVNLKDLDTLPMENGQKVDEWALLRSVEVDPYADVEKPPIALEIHTGGNVAPSFTLGNFSMVIGKAKSKKTFLLTGLAAAATSNSWAWECIKGVLPADKRGVLFFDTEQSEYHLNRTIKRVLRQASDLTNFKAFGLRKFNPAERLKLIEFALYNSPNVGLVFIDGIRDLLTKGINDEENATELTSLFLKWTAELNIHIVTVLHQNKGDQNARGHIGTEMLNKAETTISVAVDSIDKDVSIVCCEMSRDLGFEDFAFRINEEGLPEPCEMPVNEASQSRQTNPQNIANDKHFEVLAAIYKENSEPNHAELRDAIIYGFGGTFGQSKCREFISHYLNNQWIEKSRDKRKVIYKYKRAIF